MTKLSKILLCICLSIICICGVVSNTYCLNYIDSSMFNIYLKNSYLDDTNYYNNSNLSFVKFTNISFSYKKSKEREPLYFIRLPKGVVFNSDNSSMVLNDTYYMDSVNKQFLVSTTYFIQIYHLDNGDYLDIYLDNFSVSNIPREISLNDNNLSALYWRPFPTKVLTYLSNYHDGQIKYISEYVNCYNPLFFTLNYDIEYNGQFYYNQYFGIYFNCFIVDTQQMSIGNKGYNFLNVSFSDINSNIFSKSLEVSTNSNNIKTGQFILFENNYNYEYSYINHVSIYCYNKTEYSVINYSNFDLYNLFYMVLLFDNTSVSAKVNSTIYSSSTINSNSSSLIPLGSDTYYKSAPWYDIPTHLYNFFIYLIFDAPIISNFTKLAMVIISFLVETFNFVIGLFNGVSNIFFVSIFVGMLALIFLLKIIFGGKT